MKRHANVSIFVPHVGCPNQCSFCDQNRISGTARPPEPQAIRPVLEAGLKNLGDKAPEAQIAFFGGSFTAVNPDYRRALLAVAGDYIGGGGYGGIRISTRPDAIDEDILRELKASGVTAIELGVQSMDDEVLRANGRGHSASHAVEASRLIRENGFSLGHQMMTGLWQSTPEKDEETARQLAQLMPDTMRIYPTLVLQGTELARLYEAGQYQPPTLAQAVAQCGNLLAFFEEKSIKVIRLGLHSEEALTDNLLAGPYHPAFRELCESSLMLGRLRAELVRQGINSGAITVAVAVGHTSKMLGQKRCNAVTLAKEGYQLTVKEAVDMAPLAVRIAPQT